MFNFHTINVQSRTALLVILLLVLPSTTESHQLSLAKRKAVQWEQVNHMFTIYLCTGNTDWMNDKARTKELIAMYTVLVDFLCPPASTENIAKIRLVDMIKGMRSRLWTFKNRGDRIDQLCLDHRMKIFLKKLMCCPKLQKTVKNQLLKVYQNFNCDQIQTHTLCRILRYSQQSRIYREFSHLTNVSTICDICPGQVKVPDIKKSGRSKRIFDVPSVVLYIRFFVRINEKLGIDIDPEKPAVYLRQMLFICHDLMYCFLDYIFAD